MNGKINRIYKLLVEIREKVISRDYIKQVIAEVVNDEINKIREEIQQWKTAKLEALIRQAVRREVQSIKNVAATLDGTNKNTYSQAVKNQSGSVLIVKPKGEDDNNSEDTKREIKNKIDVAKLGTGITEMRRDNQRGGSGEM